MYFVVVPEGFGDEEPDIQLDSNLNHSRVVDDWVFVSGSVLSGAERGDVSVEMAFDSNAFNQSSLVRYGMRDDFTWNQSDDLCDDESMPDYGPNSNIPETQKCAGTDFTLGLKIKDQYSNESNRVHLWLKVSEGDGRNPIYHYIIINLAACSGATLPDEAVNEEVEWIWNAATKQCELPDGWEVQRDENGNITGVNKQSEDKSSGSGGGFMEDNMILVIGGGLGLVIIILLSVLILGKGDDEEAQFSASAAGHQVGAVQMDPMEAYVQQLIAQGYPEETARTYAAQYAAHFQQQAAAGYQQ